MSYALFGWPATLFRLNTEINYFSKWYNISNFQWFIAYMFHKYFFFVYSSSNPVMSQNLMSFHGIIKPVCHPLFQDSQYKLASVSVSVCESVVQRNLAGIHSNINEIYVMSQNNCLKDKTIHIAHPGKNLIKNKWSLSVLNLWQQLANIWNMFRVSLFSYTKTRNVFFPSQVIWDLKEGISSVRDK